MKWYWPLAIAVQVDCGLPLHIIISWLRIGEHGLSLRLDIMINVLFLILEICTCWNHPMFCYGDIWGGALFFRVHSTLCIQHVSSSCFHKVPIKHGTKKKMTLGVQFLLSFVWKKHCRGLRGCGVILHCNRWALLTWWLQTAPASNFSKMNLRMPSLSCSCMCYKCAVA